MTRAAIRPLREMTRVVGIPAGGTVLRKASAITSPGSFRLGYVTLKLRWNAWALAGVSLMSTPRKATPAGRSVRASDASVGASARQGVHHDPQKFITSTWPRNRDRLSVAPSSVVPVTGGASGRLLLPKTVVPLSPETKLWPLLAGVLCAMATPAQSASVRLAAAAATAAAPRRARLSLGPMAAWRG